MGGESLTPLPGGPDVTLDALRAAISRIHPATVDMWHDGENPVTTPGAALARAGPVVAAVSDALFAIAALDGYHAATIDYRSKQRAHESGRTTAGLVYVRNLAAHGLHVAVVLAHEWVSARDVFGEVWEPPSEEAAGRLILKFQFRWQSLASLPAPGRTERHDRDKWYELYVAREPVSPPLAVALEWFTAATP